MRKRFKVPLIILIIVIIVLLLFYGMMNFLKTDVKEIEVLHTLDGYGYSLEDRDNKIYSDEYYNLEKIIKSDEVNYEQYAESISKLFIIDLFTLNNKVSKYDVGGSEFLMLEYKDNYNLSVTDTIYKYIGNMNENDLPEVSSINLDSINPTTYILDETEYDAYEVSLTWDYVKDLEYDKVGYIIIIKNENKLYVVEYKNEVENEESD